jgi:hypothetical protein
MTELKFVFTHHFIQRLNQRFPNFTKNFPKIANYRVAIDNPNSFEIRNSLDKLILEGHIQKSYLNNTTYMVYLYEKYGYNMDYLFVSYSPLDCVCVLVKNKIIDTYTVATILSAQAFPTIKHKSYPSNAKPKKNHNNTTSFNSIYTSYTNLSNLTFSDSTPSAPAPTTNSNSKKTYIIVKETLEKVKMNLTPKVLPNGGNFKEYNIEPHDLYKTGVYHSLFLHAKEFNTVKQNIKIRDKFHFCSILLNNEEVFFILLRFKNEAKSKLLTPEESQHYLDSVIAGRPDNIAMLKLIESRPSIPM